jgi:hypothetical protein
MCGPGETLSSRAFHLNEQGHLSACPKKCGQQQNKIVFAFVYDFDRERERERERKLILKRRLWAKTESPTLV